MLGSEFEFLFRLLQLIVRCWRRLIVEAPRSSAVRDDGRFLYHGLHLPIHLRLLLPAPVRQVSRLSYLVVFDNIRTLWTLRLLQGIAVARSTETHCSQGFQLVFATHLSQGVMQ